MHRILLLATAGALLLAGCDQMESPTAPAAATASVVEVGSLDPGPLSFLGSDITTCRRGLGEIQSLSSAPSMMMAAASVDSVVPGDVPPVDISDGFRSSHAFSLNESETYAGYITTGGRKRAVVRPTGASNWTQLPVSADSSVAYAINEPGQIVGVQWQSNAFRAFLYSGGTTTLLPLPAGYDHSAAFAINDYGQVVGWVRRNSPFVAHAFLWTPLVPNGTTGTMVLLGVGAGPYTAAYGINNHGDVVGEIGGSGVFVWTASLPNASIGTFNNVGRPTGTGFAEGRDINEQGEVVGNAVTTQIVNGKPEHFAGAFYWSQATGFITIPPPSGGTTSHAYGINNQGVVVGRAATIGRVEQRLFLWTEQTRAMALYAKLAATCSSGGFDVNECGVVSGWSLDPTTDQTIAAKWGTCAIGVTKTAPAATVLPGDTVRFAMTVTNLTTRPAQGTTLTDPLPGGPEVVWTMEQPAPGCSISAARVLTCQFPALPSGKSRTVTVRSEATAASCGVYENTATAVAEGRGPASGSASVTIPCPPILQVTKNGTQSGSAIGFTMQVTNDGGGTAEGVTLSDPLPGGLPWTISEQPGSACTISGDTLTCDLGTLEPGATRRVSVTAPASAASCTTYENTVTVSATNHGGVSASASATIRCDGPFTTFTQGGWGSKPAGNNPGRLLHTHFSSVYPTGVQIGGVRWARFTNASAVTDYLPGGGKPAKLTANAVNPKSTAAGVFASQVLALQLNVDFSAAGVTNRGLGFQKLTSGPLAGKTISEVLAYANTALGGGALPPGISSISQLNDVVDGINNRYNQ